MYAYSGNVYAGKEGAQGQDTLKEATSSHIEVTSTASEVGPNAQLGVFARDIPKDAVTVETASVNDIDPGALLEDLEKVMAGITLKDEPAEKDVERATQLIQAYFFKHEREFRRVMVYRDRGWNHNKDKGDTYFKAQREHADKADDEGEKRFYNMMIKIGEDMDKATGALHPSVPAGRNIKVLDVCMAPGGYSAAVLKIHPDAEIFGLTLPKTDGGHSMMIPLDKLGGLKYVDVTMLASEMLKGTDKTILRGFTDAAKLNPLRPFVSHKMDLVLLDGIVLRTHERASYRQTNEPLRLSTSQLVLGMQRITQGGTLVMLMHKVDSWASVNVIYTISKFATVELFKPKSAHATRSSFYLVARDIDVESCSAAAAVAEWKSKWYNATFEIPEATGEKAAGVEDTIVLDILKTYGQELIQMGRPLWRTQADALAKTAYAGDVDDAAMAAGKKEIEALS